MFEIVVTGYWLREDSVLARIEEAFFASISDARLQKAGRTRSVFCKRFAHD